MKTWIKYLIKIYIKLKKIQLKILKIINIQMTMTKMKNISHL